MEATQTATRTEVLRFMKDFNAEAQTTRKMLAIVPEDKWDFKPHEKSMSLRTLATHVAEIAGWPEWIMVTPGLDFEATPYQPVPINTNAELMKYFEEGLEKSNAYMADVMDEELSGSWNITSGEHLIAPFTKKESIYHALYQTIHHRAQLGVYLRILNIPIPGTYGPSADEMSN